MSSMISRTLLAIRKTAAFVCVVMPFLLGSAQAARGQDGIDEQKAISGNNATIVVNVRNSSGDPCPSLQWSNSFGMEAFPMGRQQRKGDARFCFLKISVISWWSWKQPDTRPVALAW